MMKNGNNPNNFSSAFNKKLLLQKSTISQKSNKDESYLSSKKETLQNSELKKQQSAMENYKTNTNYNKEPIHVQRSILKNRQNNVEKVNEKPGYNENSFKQEFPNEESKVSQLMNSTISRGFGEIDTIYEYNDIEPDILNKIKEDYKNTTAPKKITLFIKKMSFLPTDVDLTPIPQIYKTKLKNRDLEKVVNKAERTAVHIRRIEYSNAQKGKSKVIRKDLYINCESENMRKIKFIQTWWKKIYLRNKAATLIQANFKGYLIRKKINELIRNTQELVFKIRYLMDVIRIPVVKRVFSKLFTNFATYGKKYFLDKVIYLQYKFRSYLKKKEFIKGLLRRRFCMKLSRIFYKIKAKNGIKEIKKYANLNRNVSKIQRYIVLQRIQTIRRNMIKGFAMMKKDLQKRRKEILYKLKFFKGSKYFFLKKVLKKNEKFRLRYFFLEMKKYFYTRCIKMKELLKRKGINDKIYKYFLLKLWFNKYRMVCHKILDNHEKKEGMIKSLFIKKQKSLKINRVLSLKYTFQILKLRNKIKELRESIMKKLLKKQITREYFRIVTKFFPRLKIIRVKLSKKKNIYTKYEYESAIGKLNKITENRCKIFFDFFKNKRDLIFKGGFKSEKNSANVHCDHTLNLIKESLRTYLKQLNKSKIHKLKYSFKKWFEQYFRSNINKASLKIQQYIKKKRNEKVAKHKMSTYLKVLINLNAHIKKKMVNNINLWLHKTKQSIMNDSAKFIQHNYIETKKLFLLKKKFVSLIYIHKNRMNIEAVLRRERFEQWRKKTSFILLSENKILKKPYFKFFSNQEILSQIYMAYSFKILQRLKCVLSKKLCEVVIKNYKELKKNILSKQITKSSVSYQVNKYSTTKTRYYNSHFLFEGRKHNHNNNIDIFIKLPYLVKFLNGLITNRKKYMYQGIFIFHKLKESRIGLKKLDSFNSKFDEIFLQTTFTQFVRTVNSNFIQLRYLFIRKVYLEILKVAEETDRIYKLIYTVKLAMFHTEASDGYFKKVLVKRWRFYNKIKKISKEKLKVLQDNMNHVYLNMADEFMGETGNSMKNNVMDHLASMDLEKRSSSGLTNDIVPRKSIVTRNSFVSPFFTNMEVKKNENNDN